MSEGLVRTQRPLTRWGIHALIDLVIAAVGTGVATEREISRFVRRHRKRHGRFALRPLQITLNLHYILEKLVSGGRLGEAYYRTDDDL